MPPASGSRVTSLTTFSLKVDGEALPGTISIVSVNIVHELNRIPSAHVVLYDGDAAKQDFVVSSGEQLVPGKRLEIEGGYDRHESLLFTGIITGHRIKVRRAGDSVLHIEARGPAFRMALARKSRYFTELSDGELFEEIIGGYDGLTPQVAATSIKHPEIVQYRVSDWDLVVSRAESIGLYCNPDGGSFAIAAPDLGQEPVLTLTYGVDVFDLDLEMDARTQAQAVTASAWDPTNQEVIDAEVEDVTAPAQGNLTGSDLAQAAGPERVELRHSGTLGQQEIDAWAEAAMLKSRFAKIRGAVRCQGNEKLKPGTIVELKGMGGRFNGKAFVAGVRHVLGDGDWQSAIQVGLPQNWHREAFPADAQPGAGLRTAIDGLHTGVVTQLQDDPAGEDRIRVRLPLVGAGDDGVWSRLATLDAGQERGTVFRPEIGDEVIVGFVNDDPHKPVVLGMLHSSNKPAPIAGSDDNHQKGLVTRSGLKLVFDDEKASLTIETPKGKQIAVDDDAGSIEVSDENGNKLTMKSDGIALESAGNITLKASGDLSVEGTNLKIKASASAAVEGSAGASLKSSGTTEVKGSLVQIN